MREIKVRYLRDFQDKYDKLRNRVDVVTSLKQ